MDLDLGLPHRAPQRVIEDRQLLPGQLDELLSALQQTCLEASEAIAERYFTYAQPVEWEKGA